VPRSGKDGGTRHTDCHTSYMLGFGWVIGVFVGKKDREIEGQVASVFFFVSPLLFFKWPFYCFKEEWKSSI
jgi:hypothetical protein